MINALEAYLKQDRQWPRYCRIVHAQYQLRRAIERDQQDFWLAVLRANGFFES